MLLMTLSRLWELGTRPGAAAPMEAESRVPWKVHGSSQERAVNDPSLGPIESQNSWGCGQVAFQKETISHNSSVAPLPVLSQGGGGGIGATIGAGCITGCSTETGGTVTGCALRR